MGLAGGLLAVKGGLGFLSRLPVGHDDGAWAAFRATPAAFPVVGYLVGALLALPLLLPLPAPTVGLVFVVWLYLVTGINHIDGLADIGDALVVHGDGARRLEVVKDSMVGVGAALSLAVVVLGVGLAGVALASGPVGLAAGPVGVVAIVVAAEVGAKLGMAAIACLGTATHEGFGSELTERSGPRALLLPAVLAAPAAALTWPHPAAGVAVGGAVVATLVVLWWARRRLGGVNGDVFGAANEVARLVALHAGVVAWMRL